MLLAVTASDEVDPQLLTALTTEHFVLQTARSSTISEANGRATIYLGALSSALIAFGFAADRPETFKPFASVVFPVLLVLGWFTFVRLVQTSVEAILCLTRIQKIRAYYVRLAPDEPWFADVRQGAPATGDDAASAALQTTGMRPGPVQMLFTTASMIAVLNAIVLGVGLVLLGRATDTVGLRLGVGAAVIVGVAVFTGQLWWQRRQFTAGMQAG